MLSVIRVPSRLLLALGVLILSSAVVLAGPAAAPASASVLSVPIAIPTVIGAAGIGTTIIPDTAAGAAGTAVVGGVAVGAAGYVAVGAAGLGTGYAIGWAGVKAVGFAKDKWFTDHPPPSSGSAPGTGSLILNAGGSVIGLKLVLSAAVTATSPNGYLTLFAAVAGMTHPNGAFWDGKGQCNISTTGSGSTFTLAAGAVIQGNMSYACDTNPAHFIELRLYRGGNFDTLIGTYPLNPTAYYKLRTEWQCQAPDGTITAALSADSASFTDAGSAPAAYPDAICGLPSHIVGVKHSIVGFGGSPTEVADQWNPPARYIDPNDPLADCMAKATAPCTITYRNPDGSPWTPQKNPSTGTIRPPATVDVGAHTGIAVPVTAPLPQTDPGGHPVLDPGTTPVTPDPAPSPLTTAPPVDPSHESGPAGEPGSDASRCWPSGWGLFNPIEWVLKPTECALVWAFVPQPATWTATQTSMEGAWSGSPVGSWVSASVAIPASLSIPDSGSCEGPGFSFPIPGRASVPMHPFAACVPPMSTLATAVRLIVAVGVLVGGAWLLIRQILSALGLQTATKTGEPT
jgi:hypothetical protein